MTKDEITPAMLQRFLSYDPVTGILLWKKRDLSTFANEWTGKTWNTKHAGKPAFARFDRYGYTKGTFLGLTLQGHRVAWAVHFGAWPNGEIDHVNGLKSDNAICNLRDVSRIANSQNRKIPATNTSGMMGVTFTKTGTNAGTWCARITHKGKCRHVGYFKTYDQAAQARKTAEVKYGFHQNHGRA